MSGPEPLYVALPGDKSLSHRALIFASLARGTSRLAGVLDSADVRSTRNCLRQMGVGLPQIAGTMVVQGVGVPALTHPRGDLDCGNSGTTARLLAGLIAGAARNARIVGDDSLSRRPMKRLAEPLEQMGATIAFAGKDGLPMEVTGAQLRGIDYVSEKSSAQIKSALLLAGYASRVAVKVTEPIASRDHTERMMSALGVPISTAGTTVVLGPDAPPLPPFDFDVPGDPSSAAFFAAWAVLTGNPVRTGLVSVNPTRIGFFGALKRMGAEVDSESAGLRCGEPVGRLTIGGSLTAALTLEPEYVPGMIDELPLLACVASYAPGETRVTGAGELRVKESDRIAAVVSNLRAIGADADELPDGFVVRGARRALKGRVKTHGDHRIAMAFGILGTLPGNEITVDDTECVGVSFPGYWVELRRLAKVPPQW